jgi:putative sterol carrier protein
MPGRTFMATKEVQDIIAELSRRLGARSGIGGTLKFDFGAKGSAFIDPKATPSVIDGDGKKADCTVSLTPADFDKLKRGELDATTAFMQGKLRVAGDMGLALKLGPILQKANG